MAGRGRGRGVRGRGRWAGGQEVLHNPELYKELHGILLFLMDQAAGGAQVLLQNGDMNTEGSTSGSSPNSVAPSEAAEEEMVAEGWAGEEEGEAEAVAAEAEAELRSRAEKSRNPGNLDWGTLWQSGEHFY